MTVIQRLTSNYSRRRFAFLFFSLVTTMIAAPVVAALGFSSRFMEIFLMLNILAAVLITLISFKSYVGLGLLVLVLVARVGHALLGSGSLLMTSQGAGALALLASVVIMFRYILSDETVTSECIFAALAIYLLIGVICGLVFFIFEEQWPGSFSFQGTFLNGNKRLQLEHMIYFSFVTLGTLGYGDILPISGPARALAVTEALAGQMYLVVVVARLVSLYQGSAQKSEAERQEAAERRKETEHRRQKAE
jgi:hypothetical protein